MDTEEKIKLLSILYRNIAIQTNKVQNIIIQESDKGIPCKNYNCESSLEVNIKGFSKRNSTNSVNPDNPKNGIITRDNFNINLDICSSPIVKETITEDLADEDCSIEIVLFEDNKQVKSPNFQEIDFHNNKLQEYYLDFLKKKRENNFKTKYQLYSLIPKKLSEFLKKKKLSDFYNKQSKNKKSSNCQNTLKFMDSLNNSIFLGKNTFSCSKLFNFNNNKKNIILESLGENNNFFNNKSETIKFNNLYLNNTIDKDIQNTNPSIELNDFLNDININHSNISENNVEIIESSIINDINNNNSNVYSQNSRHNKRPDFLSIIFIN